jgi:hypothetical protein
VKSADAASARPLGRTGLLVAALAFLVSVACISVLRNNLVFPTGYWNTDTELFDLRFDAQLAALFVGFVLLQAAPTRFARAIVVGEGLAVLAPYGVRGLFWIAGLFVWFYALEVPIAKRLRPLVPIALLLGAGALGTLGTTRVAEGAFFFSIFFSCRLMLYAWDKWQRGWPRGSLGDYLFHFAAPPLLAFPPYVVIIPFYGTYAKGFAPRLTAARAREAFAQIGLGLFCAVAVVALRVRVAPHLLAPAYAAASILFDYVVVVLRVGALAHVAHGLLLLHGLVDRPPLDRPLLATNYVEVWTRFQTHQKDMQMAMFFTPVLLRFRRANRYLAITAATAATLLVGNLAIHVLARYIYAPARNIERLAPLYAFFVPSFVVLAASLCFQEWRRRTKKKPPRGALGVLYTVVTWALTFAFTALLLWR